MNSTSSMNYSQLDAYLEAQLPKLLQDLKALVAINTERTAPKAGMPFGEGNAQCAQAGMELLHRLGMEAKNYDNYVITADLLPDAPKGLDILAHLDVVPAGDGWTVTEPFSMKQVDGRVYGRGTSDDKGPALCALYAMEAVRAMGIPLKKNVRLILGFDEECGSEDLEYYFGKETSAPFSVSPDADFPLINIELGGIHSGFCCKLPLAEQLPRVVSVFGGQKVNVIPGKAEAVVQGIDEAAVLAAAKGICDAAITCRPTESGLLIQAAGSTGHASRPDCAHNAVTALLTVLAALPLSDAPIHSCIRAAARLFPHGDMHGTALGVDLEDAVSGKTVLSLTMCRLNEAEGFTGLFDCRACLSANRENTEQVIYAALKKAGLPPLEENTMYPPHHVPEGSPLVQTLLDIYEEMTGTQPKPLCIGGGTYVHEIENGVAFGCSFENLDNRAHAADEFMTLEQIRFACKIYARTIIALCGA